MSLLEVESTLRICRYIGNLPPFTSDTLIMLTEPKLGSPKEIDQEKILFYRQALEEAKAIPLDDLFKIRITLCLEADPHEQYNHFIKLMGITEEFKTIVSATLIKSYLINSIDAILYQLAIENGQELFYEIKEFLYYTEDYRDQLSLFIELRKNFIYMRKNSLQKLLIEEHQSSKRFLKGLYAIYDTALLYFEKQKKHA